MGGTTAAGRSRGWGGCALLAALAASAAAAAGPCGPPLAEAGGLSLDRDLGRGRWLCVRADAGVLLDERDGAVLELPEGRRLVVGAGAGSASRSLLVRRQGDTTLYDWEVDGRPLPFDDAARSWMEDALVVVAAIREGDRIRGEAEAYGAQIAALIEDESRLRDEIGALLEERGRLERRVGEIRSEERELREEIAALRGEESALRVAAGDHRNAIASLAADIEAAEASRRADLEAERARRQAALEATLERLRREDHARRIEALEERMAALDTAERVSAVEARIAALDVDDRVEAIEERIRALQVRERNAALRTRIRYAQERLGDLRRRVEARADRLAPTR